MKPLSTRDDLKSELIRIISSRRDGLLEVGKAYREAAGLALTVEARSFVEQIEENDFANRDMGIVTEDFFSFVKDLYRENPEAGQRYKSMFVDMYCEIINALDSYRQNNPEAAREELKFIYSRPEAEPIHNSELIRLSTFALKREISPEYRQAIEERLGWQEAIKDEKSNPSLLTQR